MVSFLSDDLAIPLICACCRRETRQTIGWMREQRELVCVCNGDRLNKHGLAKLLHQLEEIHRILSIKKAPRGR